MKYGYVRVSTDGPSEQLRAAGEERKRAKARGVKLGQVKLNDHQRKEAIKRRDRGGGAIWHTAGRDL